MSFDPVTAVLDVGSKLIGHFFPDPKDAAAAQLKLAELAQTGQAAQIAADTGLQEVQGRVIVAEAQSDSWLAKNWRPMTMLIFVSIVANNFIVAPYAQAIFHQSVSLPTPPDLWELIKIGLGGYVVGRSAEKVVSAWAGKGS